jgi:hypothetical protein
MLCVIAVLRITAEDAEDVSSVVAFSVSDALQRRHDRRMRPLEGERQ